RAAIRFWRLPVGRRIPHGSGFVTVSFFAIDCLNAGQRLGLFANNLDAAAQGRLVVLQLNDQVRLRRGGRFESFFWQCMASSVTIWPATSSSSNSFWAAGISLDFSSIS